METAIVKFTNPDSEGTEITLTFNYDREAETVTIIYQVVGYSTELLSKMKAGDSVIDFVGPLGQPAPLHKVNQYPEIIPVRHFSM